MRKIPEIAEIIKGEKELNKENIRKVACLLH